MKHPNIMKARQIKAARALLDWSQCDLANACNLHIGTIRKIELGYISPRAETMAGIKNAFEHNGLEFLEPDGVRHRPDHIATYRGAEGILHFFDNILYTLKKSGEEVVVVSGSDPLFKGDTEYDSECKETLAAIADKGVIKCLLTDEHAAPLTAIYSECRSLSKNYVNPAQFYVYGDKFAVFETTPFPKIIVIQSLSIARAMRLQFYSMWDKASLHRNTMGAEFLSSSQRTINYLGQSL